MTYYVNRKECIQSYAAKSTGYFKPDIWVFKKTKGWSKIDIELLNKVKNPRLFYIGQEAPVDIDPSVFYAVVSNKKLIKKFQETIYLTFYMIAQDPITNLYYITVLTTVRECFQAYQDNTLKFERIADAQNICSFLNNLVKKD